MNSDMRWKRAPRACSACAIRSTERLSPNSMFQMMSGLRRSRSVAYSGSMPATNPAPRSTWNASRRSGQVGRRLLHLDARPPPVAPPPVRRHREPLRRPASRPGRGCRRPAAAAPARLPRRRRDEPAPPATAGRAGRGRPSRPASAPHRPRCVPSAPPPTSSRTAAARGRRPPGRGWAGHPTTPQKPAGVRTLPPRSDPVASHTWPLARAAAEPPDEPPQVREVSHGLRVSPNTSLKVLPPAPNSGVFDFATTTAPRCSSRSTMKSERSGTWSA